jgi:hypothetical protein
MWLMICACLFLNPGEPYDPGACAACAQAENDCEDDCDAECEAGIIVCMSAPLTPSQLAACLDAVDLEFDICVMGCDADARVCAWKHDCPVLAIGR